MIVGHQFCWNHMTLVPSNVEPGWLGVDLSGDNFKGGTFFQSLIGHMTTRTHPRAVRTAIGWLG